MQGYPMPTETQWAEIVAADASMRECVRDVVQDRQQHPRDDLVSRLLDASASEEEVSFGPFPLFQTIWCFE